MTRPTSLFERHRPATFSEVVGQDIPVNRLCTLLGRGGLGGRAYWLNGPSGCGKTTLARLIARKVAGPEGLVEEQDAQEATPRCIRDIEDSWAIPSLFGGRAHIFNEAHGLRKDGLRAFLCTLESGIPKDAVVIFTTASPELPGDMVDGAALLSRCVRLPLTGGKDPDWIEAAAQAARKVAVAEGMDGLPIERYRLLAADKGGNLRAILQAIDCGEHLE